MQIKFILIIFMIFQTLFLNSQDLVISDVKEPNQSFNFNVKAHDIFIPGQKFFVAADQAVANNIFAVSSNLYGNLGFKPLALKQVTLNNNILSENPLCGAAISHLKMAGYSPIVVKKGEPIVYVINDAVASAINVYSTDEIMDSSGEKSGEILSIISDLPKQLEAPETLYNNHMIFIAVAKNRNNFEDNSLTNIQTSFDGIALAQLRGFKGVNNGQEMTYLKFVQFDAQTGLEGNRAAPITPDSDVVKIGSDLSKIGNIADLYFDTILNRLYIALDLQAGGKNSDGAKAIVVAGLAGNKIIFQSIAPDSALFRSCKVINSIGSKSKITINKVRTMFTRTYLNYLIVVKDNQKVFALPLVNNTGSEFHGCLANIDAKAINVFTSGLPHKFLTRTFLEEARNPEHLYDDTNLQCQVGAGAPLPGNITDIEISGDAVFVSVENNDSKYNTEKSGIFHSQALFDDSGKIMGWTKWSRAALEPINTSGFSFNPITSNFWNIPVSNYGNNLISNNVFKTKWSIGDSDLEKLISREFLKDLGGVQNLVDFDYNMQGFNKTPGNRLSFLLLTGLAKVGLIESARDIDNTFTPTLNSQVNNKLENTIFCQDGKVCDLNNMNNIANLFISGGDLNKIGNITSSAIVSDSNYAWLVVAGSSGMAVLCKKDGSGWPLNPGLSNGFKELSGLSFELVGDYKSVLKIIGIKNRLYVLTDKKLDRLEFNLNFLAKSISTRGEYQKVNILAKVNEHNLEDVEVFTDMSIIEPLGLLSTSNGFFRSGTDVDISRVVSDNYAKWTLVPMPEAVGNNLGNGMATRIFPIFQFKNLNDKIANLYLLNAYSGYEQAQMYRFSVSLKDYKVHDNSVLLFQDIFIKDKATFFVNLEDYRNYIYADGATIAASKPSFMGDSPKLFILPYNLRSSQRFGARSLVSLDLDLEKFKSIGQLTKTYSGAFLVYGDFGIRFN